MRKHKTSAITLIREVVRVHARLDSDGLDIQGGENEIFSCYVVFVYDYIVEITVLRYEHIILM